MKKVEFFGAADNEVTGSCTLVTAGDDNQVLVDFGMFQGGEETDKKNYTPLGFHPPSLQAVFLTHAHLDHSGRLPMLARSGFRGKIYMTPPTQELVSIILSDAARIAEKDLSREPLFYADDVDKVFSMIKTANYDEEITAGSFTAIFRDAGHILGSASIVLTDISGDVKKTIVFSGDLGNTPQDIVRPTKLIDAADYVVMESTYGSSTHPLEDVKQIIQEEINGVENSGGALLIPAFALERTQEILHIIHHLKKDGKILSETPVFLDSPMAIDATTAYMNYKEYYNEEIISHEDNPFEFEGLIITEDGRDSRKILKQKGAKVIIAGSGMMSGGRILNHATNYLGYETTRLLFVGYQGEGTIGREILDGAKSVQIGRASIKIRSRVREIKTLSSHADQPRLLAWLGHIKNVRKVFLTHGEEEQRNALAEKIKTDLKIPTIVLPKDEEPYTLA